MRATVALVMLAVILALPGGAAAQPLLTPGDRAVAAAAAARQARALLEDGQYREALALLKREIERLPGELSLRWLLARAYLQDGNDFWALRTLADLAGGDPAACDPGLWTAWIQLRQGALDAARESLSAVRCPDGSPSAARRALLWAQVAHHAGERAVAQRHLEEARGAARVFAEDRPALDQLTATLDPGFVVPFSGKLDLTAGWTANARAGSPADPARLGADPASPVGQLGLWLRFVAPTGRQVRPSLEVETRALGYTAGAGRDYSTVFLGGRPGVLLGGGETTTLLAYRIEALLLAGGDRYASGPLWFSNAHRAELEVGLPKNLTVFAGAGRRLFRETGRSRLELDGGAGGGVLLNRRLRLLWAATARLHGADKDAYDLRGLTLLLSAEQRLPGDWALRAGALLALDWYPQSAGAFDAAQPGLSRRDVLGKLSASAYSPAFWGIKAGVTYEAAQRFSTTAPYDYRDHRILLRLTWSFAADPWAPAAVSPAGHVPLDHEATGAAGFEERLQDLLRQDEAAQRSSSCVE